MNEKPRSASGWAWLVAVSASLVAFLGLIGTDTGVTDTPELKWFIGIALVICMLFLSVFAVTRWLESESRARRETKT